MEKLVILVNYAKTTLCTSLLDRDLAAENANNEQHIRNTETEEPHFYGSSFCLDSGKTKKTFNKKIDSWSFAIFQFLRQNHCFCHKVRLVLQSFYIIIFWRQI